VPATCVRTELVFGQQQPGVLQSETACDALVAGNQINFATMAAEYPYAAVPLSSRVKSGDSLIIILSALDPPPVPRDDPGRYVVVFRYGAVVCFNLSLKEIEQTLEIARRFTQHAYKSATTDGRRTHHPFRSGATRR
jgi:uncharacterized Rmd1/YagE family protein